MLQLLSQIAVQCSQRLVCSHLEAFATAAMQSSHYHINFLKISCKWAETEKITKSQHLQGLQSIGNPPLHTIKLINKGGFLAAI